MQLGGAIGGRELGNLDAKRDWGFAREYVDGMWRMLQAPEPGVYVLASGQNASVRDFVALAAKAADIEITWQGSAEHEQGIDPNRERRLFV